MSPQEKAKELIDQFLPEVQGADRYNYNVEDMNVFIAKKIALTAVKEIRLSLTKYCEFDTREVFTQAYTDLAFWARVEEELKNE